MCGFAFNTECKANRNIVDIMNKITNEIPVRYHENSNKMKNRDSDLSMELYIIDYAVAFLLMLGGFTYLLFSHIEELMARSLIYAFINLIN